MTITPDPKTVREIAREATQRAARRRDYIGSALTDHDVMREILASGDRSAWGRWSDAIRAEMETATVTVSWPDEQPQDERDARIAELEREVRQLRAGAVRGWKTDWRDPISRFENFVNATRNYDSDHLGGIMRGGKAEATITLGDLRAVLARLAELEACDASAADAAQNARSATQTTPDGTQAHGDGSNSSTTAAGLSEREPLRATQLRFADSNSPWSAWLVDRLLDREWLASDLAEASGGVFNTAQVARWLHSQDVPEPFMAMLAAQACDASVVDALRAAEHGVLVDAIIEEHAERLEQLAKCPCGCEGTECGCGLGGCACMGACPVCDSSADSQTKPEPLRDEYGIRADFLDTTSAEFTVAETLDEALRALDEFDAKHGGRVVSRELVQRPVGGWRKVGDRG